MAAPGTLTPPRVADLGGRFHLQPAYFLLMIGEDTPTGVKEIARYRHETSESALESGVSAQTNGFVVIDVVEVYARDKVSGQ